MVSVFIFLFFYKIEECNLFLACHCSALSNVTFNHTKWDDNENKSTLIYTGIWCVETLTWNQWEYTRNLQSPCQRITLSLPEECKQLNSHSHWLAARTHFWHGHKQEMCWMHSAVWLLIEAEPRLWMSHMFGIRNFGSARRLLITVYKLFLLKSIEKDASQKHTYKAPHRLQYTVSGEVYHSGKCKSFREQRLSIFY